MTRDELVAALEAELGLKLWEGGRQHKGEYLIVRSPSTGKPLFTVSIGENPDGTWTFGGAGDLLREHWINFCRLGRTDK